MGSLMSSLGEMDWWHVLLWMSSAAIGITALILFPSIVWPTIISYPWQFPDSPRQREKDKQRVVVLAGSYNPPHNGHLAMLEYLAARYGQVIAVVGMNPNKRYQVSPDERAQLIREMVLDSDVARNVRVEVVPGLIWRYAKKQGGTIFFRGIRSWEIDGGDERSLQILNTWGPLVLGPLTWPIPTHYLEGKPEYNHISSTLIRELCSKGRPKDVLSGLVSMSIAEAVAEMYTRPAEKS